MSASEGKRTRTKMDKMRVRGRSIDDRHSSIAMRDSIDAAKKRSSKLSQRSVGLIDTLPRSREASREGTELLRRSSSRSQQDSVRGRSDGGSEGGAGALAERLRTYIVSRMEKKKGNKDDSSSSDSDEAPGRRYDKHVSMRETGSEEGEPRSSPRRSRSSAAGPALRSSLKKTQRSSDAEPHRSSSDVMKDRPSDAAARKMTASSRAQLSKLKKSRAAEDGDDDDQDDDFGEDGGEEDEAPAVSEEMIQREQEEKQKKEEKDAIFRIQVQAMGVTFPTEREDRQRPFMGSMLENHLQESDLAILMKVFENAPDRVMDQQQLQEALSIHIDLPYSDTEMDELFKKMDTERCGKVGWNEFLSFVLLEIQAKSAAETVEDLVLPMSGHPRICRSFHRFPVVRVAFFPVMQPDRSVTFLIGRYATISRDGRLNYWTLDFEKDSTASAATGGHRITETWITDMVCMPDVSVVCTSSTHMELNFFDTTAQKFEQRFTITHMPEPVITLAYHFWREANRASVLVCGDLRGNVVAFLFDNSNHGAFRYTHSQTYMHLRLDQLMRGMNSKIRVRAFAGVHSDVVKQVGFFPATRCVLSCAATDADSLVLQPLGEEDDDPPTVIRQPRGITCFVIVNEKHLVVTGCMDGAVLVWDLYVPSKWSFQLVGHNSPVLVVVAQDEGRRVYSMARDRSVKCWDVHKQKCVQTYLGVPAEIGSSLALSFCYNEVNRCLVVAGAQIAILVLGAAVDKQRSDGFTHTMGVVRALYNPLYKCVVTVGLDSVIMVWDVWEGKRMLLIRDAHTRLYYGVPTPMEITTAAFDPDFQFLITGARDGSIKIWNFNMGYCVRTMNVEPFCEVTGILWIRDRILTVGWDRHVTEFNDEDRFAEPRVWETRHTDDVLCLAVRQGQSIATSSYNGELILWRVDTGQAYRRYNVGTPRARIILTYTRAKKKKAGNSILVAGTKESIPRRSVERMSVYSRPGTTTEGFGGLVKYKAPGVTKDFVLRGESFMAERPSRRSSMSGYRQSLVVRSKDPVGSFADSARLLSGAAQAAASAAAAAAVQQATGPAGRRGSTSSLGSFQRRASLTQRATADASMLQRRTSLDPLLAGLIEKAIMTGRQKQARRVSVVRLPVNKATKRQVFISAMVFLPTRPMHPDWGTLMCGLDKGLTQVWSHHPGGKYLGSFLSIHLAGDYVSSMGVDKEDKYLFTGTSLGYIKIWLMSNFAFPGSETVKVCMPLLRLQFPFLWKDRVEGRAKRSLRDQPLPLLLSSYRGHLMSINSIEFMDEQKVVITSSADTTVRLWSLSGLYLGTLGGHHEWRAFAPEPSSPAADRPPDQRPDGADYDEEERRLREESRSSYPLDDRPPTEGLQQRARSLSELNPQLKLFRVPGGGSATVAAEMAGSRVGSSSGGGGGGQESNAWRRKEDKLDEFRIPADIRLVMSSTTLKVLRGGNVPRTHLKLLDDSDLLRALPQRLLEKATYGRRPGKPLLGKYIRMPAEEPTEEPPVLDVSSHLIPVYCHLRFGILEDIRRPSKPPMLLEMKKRRQQQRKKQQGESHVKHKKMTNLRSVITSLMSNLTSKTSEGFLNRTVRRSTHPSDLASTTLQLKNAPPQAEGGRRSSEVGEAGDRRKTKKSYWETRSSQEDKELSRTYRALSMASQGKMFKQGLGDDDASSSSSSGGNEATRVSFAQSHTKSYFAN